MDASLLGLMAIGVGIVAILTMLLCLVLLIIWTGFRFQVMKALIKNSRLRAGVGDKAMRYTRYGSWAGMSAMLSSGAFQALLGLTSGMLGVKEGFGLLLMALGSTAFVHGYCLFMLRGLKKDLQEIEERAVSV